MSERPPLPPLPPLPGPTPAAPTPVAASEAAAALALRAAVAYRLVPLDCPTCGAPIAAEGQDVVYYCTACRNGYRLADGGAGRLERVDVQFLTLPGKRVDRHLPFWLLPARLTILERDGGGAGALLDSLFGGDGVALGTPVDGRFVVPAFDVALAATLELVTSYTGALPAFGDRLGERLTGGCYGPEDAKKLAEWAVIATEAAKRDTLKDLRYVLQFGAPQLLGVPFVRAGEGWADAVFGIAV